MSRRLRIDDPDQAVSMLTQHRFGQNSQMESSRDVPGVSVLLHDRGAWNKGNVGVPAFTAMSDNVLLPYYYVLEC